MESRCSRRRYARNSSVRITAGRVRRRLRGFTLVELLIVMAMFALLLSLLVPSLSGARRQAYLAACAARMHGTGSAISQFAAAGNNRLPPFAFSDYRGDLPLSGHWGGRSQPGDPDCFGRREVENVNLWRLVSDGYAIAGHLYCPAAPASTTDGPDSYFPHTSKFATYCLRMPYSDDLFQNARALRNWGGRGLMGIYTRAAGGYEVRFGTEHLTVPLARLDLTYREIEPVSGRQRRVSLSSGAILSDTFWYQDHRKSARATPGIDTYRVRAGWSHRSRFNVLFGDGAVQAIDDDGTIAENSIPPGQSVPDDGANYASYAIRVWRYFEDNR